MNEIRYDGNIFLLPEGPEAAVVTTNGMVKKDGRAVMGAGIARYARDEFHGIDELLGQLLKKYGNRAYFMGSWQDGRRSRDGLSPSVFVATMPTKRDWRDPSDPALIRTSAAQLMTIADRNNLRKIYLPAPGCSNGGLDYLSQVRPVLLDVLDGRFTICLPSAIYDTVYPKGETA